ncbi:uracil-DNA glycosylase family protein [Sphingomonas sp. SUN019]|uniref:uracil-DNA glycosylase family protein n=1 Tax=Sphingomonas sp. SUN019 TaxID=2937788 RepID=UPI002164D2A1|nr:uracil-DNA glycosylase family protein [Sphingomonas sp. SUN019]UVO49658.1 uracil-DNA glycosylase family protein [Sphingomonas sp. SUN019]
MSQVLINAFHNTANLKRDAVFDDQRLMPICAQHDALTAAPGWIGKNWRPGGTLLMAINPGGGGDTYRINPADVTLYGLIRRFRDAASSDERAAGLRALSDAWIGIQATHNIRRVVDAVLDATGSDASQAAFLNVVPFRTRGDRPARSAELRRAWLISTQQQVAALAPRRIVALGCKAYDALVAAGADRSHDVVLLKRAIGDSRITPQAKEVLTRLREERE